MNQYAKCVIIYCFTFGVCKLELGNLNRFKQLAELNEAIALWIYHYNHECIQLALKTTPAAYAASLHESSDKVFAEKVD